MHLDDSHNFPLSQPSNDMIHQIQVICLLLTKISNVSDWNRKCQKSFFLSFLFVRHLIGSPNRYKHTNRCALHKKSRWLRKFRYRLPFAVRKGKSKGATAKFSIALLHNFPVCAKAKRIQNT
jgi:hypothetical protein